jgi:hypothetical protein
MAASNAPRIDVEQAYRDVQGGDALLVCAYDDEAKCEQIRLAGALTLHELEARLPSLPASKEIILYCA